MTPKVSKTNTRVSSCYSRCHHGNWLVKKTPPTTGNNGCLWAGVHPHGNQRRWCWRRETTKSALTDFLHNEFIDQSVPRIIRLTVFLFFTCWLHSVKFYLSGAVASACIMFLTSRYFSDIIVCKISSSAAGRPFYDRVRLIRFCQKPALWSEHHIRNIVTYWKTLGWVTSW